ncbi:hypothetical protein BJY52DRAFT_1213778 [Lactarius psammicola]|nr:hypothetical protein BJY52DRAFT_1213778 [Lactarius psammicola]
MAIQTSSYIRLSNLFNASSISVLPNKRIRKYTDHDLHKYLRHFGADLDAVNEYTVKQTRPDPCAGLLRPATDRDPFVRREQALPGGRRAQGWRRRRAAPRGRGRAPAQNHYERYRELSAEIYSRIVSLHAKTESAVLGGPIGVDTKIDPTQRSVARTGTDSLAGDLLGTLDKLQIFTGAHVPRLTLVTKVAMLVKGRLLPINIGLTLTGRRVLSVWADLAKIYPTLPGCTEIGEKVALSRRIEKHWGQVSE